MAAPVRIEDEAFGDIRYDVLASACHLADADHARGKMLNLWRQCTAQARHVLPRSMIVAVLGQDGPAGIVEAGLGEEHPEGIRIKGTEGRIEWLAKLRENAAKGGAAKAAKRLPSGNPDGSQTAARRVPPACPTTTAPTTAPTQEKEDSDTPAAVGSLALQAFKAKVDRKRPKPNDPTPDERASAVRVLSKLSSRNGVRYTGSPEHLRIIVSQLRAGVTEADLRLVIGYCAVELEWADKPEMATYLRPETLFGPKTINRYLDPARTWAEKHGLTVEDDALAEGAA